jgi:hypothetical protein
MILLIVEIGRCISQAVIRQLPIAAARVRALVKSCGICDGQSGTDRKQEEENIHTKEAHKHTLQRE